MPTQQKQWTTGSQWHRWDPHIHTPGTLLADEFAGDWENYLKQLETASPAVSALGITNYYTLRSYKLVRTHMKSGRLKDIPLVFPNIEMRMSIETRTGPGVNVHLLVDPTDGDHVERIEDRLNQLQFAVDGESFSCSDDGLIRLGRKHTNKPSLEEEAALSEGANQYKVFLNDLQDLFKKSEWMKKNVLVAVAAGQDGLAGLAKDGSFKMVREELGRFANIIFSPNPSDREFWLGHHPDFKSRNLLPRPCLHGSDAHALERVLKPAQDRICWIKSAPTFEGLRQALIEPERRVWIGAVPPDGPSASQTISKANFKNTQWLTRADLAFNSGLVTIIGAKGSGKTALVDLLTCGVGGADQEPGSSFVRRASPHLGGMEIDISWGDGGITKGNASNLVNGDGAPRLRYLSQQFVDGLCDPAKDDFSASLTDEIERVVFDSIPTDGRYGCTNFPELRSMLLEDLRIRCAQDRETISHNTKLVAQELGLIKEQGNLKGKLETATRSKKAIEEAIKKIPVKGSADHVAALKAVTEEIKKLTEAIVAEEVKARKLSELHSELKAQLSASDRQWEGFKFRYQDLLPSAQWDSLRMAFQPGALDNLAQKVSAALEKAGNLRKTGLDKGDGKAAKGMEALTLEQTEISKLLGVDAENLKQKGLLEQRLIEAQRAEASAEAALKVAMDAPARRKAAQDARQVAYKGVFDALAEEEGVLVKLYGSLEKHLKMDEKLARLGFPIRRIVDFERWVESGEKLFDLRKNPFGTNGGLATAAGQKLLPAWQNGNAEQVSSSLREFIEQHWTKAMEALAANASPLMVGDWLFSTEHISVQYGIKYEGLELSRLSPGTRGIVLLTLYLALDQWDLRPLVIDQPEENLDPKSVFDDLVPFFREAAKRRQVFIVTHNANLVVNTDSDQVVVAEAIRKSEGELPQVTYWGGGLEQKEVREAVCQILEGGEEAFRKRSERYRVSVK